MIRRCVRCGQQYTDEIDRCVLDGGDLELVPMPPPPRDPRIGMVLSERYRIEARIGRGGMGAVYRARHVPLLRDVAIKVLNDECARDPLLVKRFVREARAANLLRHENVIDIYDVCQEGSTVFLVMELLHGEPLADLIGRGPISVDEAIDIATPVASALARAHAVGVVHRDIKPENIFLSIAPGRPRVRVLDFGIAHVRDEVRLTKTHQIFGTVEYMSPEQLTGQRTTPATDLYALGAMLFEMLTGRTPFEGDAVAVTSQQLKSPPPDLGPLCPDAPEALVALVMRLLSKDPVARPSSAHEVMDALRRIRQSRGVAHVESIAPDARREREQLLRTAVAAAYPDDARPVWIDVALAELSARLGDVHTLETRIHGLARDITRAEQQAQAQHDQLVTALESVDADLAALEGEEVSLTQAMGPFEARAAEVTEALATRWLTLRGLMERAWDPSPESLDAMEHLGREAPRYREARAALDAHREALSKHAKRRAEVEAQCDGLRERLASLDDETRHAIASLRDTATALGAQIAAHQSAFAARAEAVERHLANFPGMASLIPPKG
jgi:eukaryotic-like serine/threonine-protein kinase